MHARREHALHSFARHHRIEERPDSVVGCDDCFDTGSKVTCRAGLDDVELGVVRAVQQQAVSLDEVGQELVCGKGSRRRIDDAYVGVGVGDERIHRFALGVCRRVCRAFGCETDAQSFRDSPDVEQHAAQDEDLEALAKRSFAARSLYHPASLRSGAPLTDNPGVDHELRPLIAAIVVGATLAVPAASAPLGIRVPAGFRVETFARGLSQPTAMAYGPDDRIYVTQTGGTLVAIRPGTRRPAVLVRRLRTPLGLAWRGRTLFVSEQGRLERFTLSGGRLVDRRVVVKGLPFGRHQQDNVVLGRDGRLYWGSGSTCDACRERSARSATILSLRPDGSDLRVDARGLRNPYGLAFQPGTGRLYASVNGQDEIGTRSDPEPAEMVVVVHRGAFYGWPRCWPNARTLTMSGRCTGVTRPAAYLEPHASADGIAFYTGRSFPRGYRGNLFVAEWGEYLNNRFGRRVVRVELRPNGTARRVSVFASGFGHPLALLVDHRGGLLVADWGRGVVYRIQARSRQ